MDTLPKRITPPAHQTQTVADVPLVVDLDGTLIKIDSLHEAFVLLASRQPLAALRALLMLRRGRAFFKSTIADHVLPNAETVPVNEAVFALIRQAKDAGRSVYLATAADRRFAEAISKAFGAFDGVFASENGTNLKGSIKADELVEAFGLHGFDYIGNDTADIPVWRTARTAIAAGATSHKAKQIARECPNLINIDEREFALTRYLLALRPHQWLKNVLLALPAIAAHDFSPPTLIAFVIAFISFSFGASSVYLINDMIDIPYDRAHAEKRYRAIAAGLVPVSQAAILLAVTVTISIGLASTLPWVFLLILVTYFFLSVSYSTYLKRKLMIDVVALAALYGIRVLAGGAATSILLSHWLVAFCFFIFLSLALVKRTSEMIALPEGSVGKIGGRGYRPEDVQSIMALNAASGFVAVLILALYINSMEVRSLYHRPELLWGICIVLVYWLGRVYFLTGRGEMRQDPVIFTVTDRISLLTGLLVAAIFLAAM